MTTNNRIKLLLLIIIFVAGFLRLYKITEVPPSLSWDEVAVGYNAWTIANYGRDEYGKFMPFFFQSFGEGKNPVHIYTTALFVKLLGLNEFSTRLPSALFGTANVILIYILAKLLFKNNFIALSGAFFLAISPYNIHFSHFNHEANFALSFLLLGLILFLLSIKDGKPFLALSIISFFLSFISYNAAKIFVPLLLISMFIIYKDRILRYPRQILLSSVLVAFFLLFLFKNPQLLGGTRASQTIQGKEEIEKTILFKLTKNEILGRINLATFQYTRHFQEEFLFISGDKNPRLSPQATGQFYKIDVIFLLAGFAFLLKRRSKEGLLVLTWALLAPIPSSLFAEAPHAARASFMMGSWHIVSALGFYFITSLIKSSFIRRGAIIVGILILIAYLTNFLNYYLGEYSRRYAIEWQYGMKQIVEFVKENPSYNPIFVTDVRGQPYIFFLYFLKTPLPEYLNTVLYNNFLSKSYNNVVNFDKFFFVEKKELIEGLPILSYLYVVSPDQYDGLQHKSSFDVKKIIYYPNETVAFYLISVK